MAKMKVSGFVARISGKAGNAVYKWTKEGVILTDRELPTNPKTASQQAVRTAFKKATQQWKTLTAPQMQVWRDYAATRAETEETTGRKFELTGFNWFVKFAARYFAVNPSATSAPTTPPANDFNGDTITLSVTASSGGVKFTASAANGTNITTALLVQRLANAGRTPQSGGYRTKAYFTFTSGSLNNTVPLPPGYYAVGYEFVNTQTGQESQRVLLGTVGPVSFAVQSGGGEKKKAA